MKNKYPKQHVIKNGGHWAVKKGGSLKVTRIYATKEQAVAAGRKLAINQKAEFYIHSEDGGVMKKDNYNPNALYA